MRRLPTLLIWLLVTVVGRAAVPFATWYPRSPTPTLNTLNSVACGNGRFVAVGNNGTIVGSTNGLDWELCPSPTGQNLNKVVVGNGRFVAAGKALALLTMRPLSDLAREPTW